MTTSAEVAAAIEGLSPNAKGYIHILCPDCQAPNERKSKLWVSTHSGWWKCWRCDVRGRLRGDWEDEDDGWEDVDDEPVAIEDPSEYHALPGASRALEPARAYLRGRGVPEAVWGEARLGYARKGRHGGRIIMPIWHGADPWVGWVGAATRRPHPIPYWTAEGMDRQGLFYNDAALAAATDAPLIVTEGPFDALRHWPNAVACLGKPTDDQVKRLRAIGAHGRPIIMALDGDAWREGVGIAESLRVDGRRAYAVVLPRGEDLDSTHAALTREGIEYALAHGCDVDLRND